MWRKPDISGVFVETITEIHSFMLNPPFSPPAEERPASGLGLLATRELRERTELLLRLLLSRSERIDLSLAERGNNQLVALVEAQLIRNERDLFSARDGVGE